MMSCMFLSLLKIYSVDKAVGKGVNITFKESEYISTDVNQKLIAVTMKVGSLYHAICAKDCVYSATKKTDCLSKVNLWYH